MPWCFLPTSTKLSVLGLDSLGSYDISYPRCSMYGIFKYIWVIFRANVGKYSIHGAYGLGKMVILLAILVILPGILNIYWILWVAMKLHMFSSLLLHRVYDSVTFAVPKW